MAKPLFTEAEIRMHRKRKEGLKWEEADALDRARQIETVRRIHERPDEYLNGLLVIIKSKGSIYFNFDAIFENSDYAGYVELVSQSDTPEHRRVLHTIFKALTEIPRSWARSAFVRFLRGVGKQRESRYYGAGLMGPQYGWTDREVTAICEVIAGDTSPYAKVLMSYVDVQTEIEEDDPEYEVVDYGVHFKATRVERDVRFLNLLCEILEKRGLAPVPEARERAEKKPRVPKIFKPRDIIRNGTLCDLPLPAHVKVPIMKRPKGAGIWTSDFLEQVVIALVPGRYAYASIVPNNPDVAYRVVYQTQPKNVLAGAVYLGPWKGKIEKNKQVKYNFEFRYGSE